MPFFPQNTKTENPAKTYRPEGRKPIAVKTWTTASGNVYPLMFKMADEDGEIHSYYGLKVYDTQKSSSIFRDDSIIEFYCTVTIRGIPVKIMLLYDKSSLKWSFVDNT